LKHESDHGSSCPNIFPDRTIVVDLVCIDIVPREEYSALLVVFYVADAEDEVLKASFFEASLLYNEDGIG
jgi:hypothetical protein